MNVPRGNSHKHRIFHSDRIFQMHCAGCHGMKGDGKGPNSITTFPYNILATMMGRERRGVPGRRGCLRSLCHLSNLTF
jgi:hypothetical protein